MYSEKIIENIIKKYAQETSFDVSFIRKSIIMFHSIKESNQVINKDITKYSWYDLREVLINYKQKKKRCGKISQEKNDQNLLYDENDIRVYYAPDKYSAIKYGNGYSFCISSRSDDNMFSHYCYELKNTIYFIFNDKYKNRKGIHSKELTVYLINEKGVVQLYDANNNRIPTQNNKFDILNDILIYRNNENNEYHKFSLGIDFNHHIHNLSDKYKIENLVNDIDSGLKMVSKYNQNDGNITIYGFGYDKVKEYDYVTTKSSQSYIIPMKRVLYVERTKGKRNLDKHIKKVKTDIMIKNDLDKCINELKNIIENYKNSLLTYILNISHS